MKILFLDQSGHLGGAELCLLDIAKSFLAQSEENDCLVALFSVGPFQSRLEESNIPAAVLSANGIQVRKESGLIQGLSSLSQLVPLVSATVKAAKDYDVIYANTPKALIVGALASFVSRRPLIYHLHDIISPEHFSSINQKLLIVLSNRFSAGVITNSEASQTAFIAAGGKAELTTVIYNGFNPNSYQIDSGASHQLRELLNVQNQFVVGHFSRLSPWKGQHVLIEALSQCPQTVVALLVGDALFGEDDYARSLKQQVQSSGLESRVQFLGFRSDVSVLMAACDLVVHSSTAPEPFGRVIVEAMLCGTPVVAAAAGGVTELITTGETGWLCSPSNSQELTDTILTCQHNPKAQQIIAQKARTYAQKQFDLDIVCQKIILFVKERIAYS